jgi:hypothetical protein
MERIIHDTAAPDLHGSGKDGFQDRVRGVRPASVVTQKWLNEVQEEVVGSIESAGLTPAAGGAQLTAAIKALSNKPVCCLSINGNTIDNGEFTLSIIQEIPNTFAVASSTDLTVPEVGWYKFTLAGSFFHGGVSAEETLDIRVKDGGTTVLTAKATRGNYAGATYAMVISAVALYQVTNIATQIFTVENQSGDTVDPDNARLIVEMVRYA